MKQGDIKPSVLLVEDDVSAANLIERVLRGIRQEMEVDWCNSAEEAIELIETAHLKLNPKPYDLIVSDIYLEGPKIGMDFWDVARKLYPDIPFVMMSSTDLDDFLEQEDGDPVPYFLKKPFDIKRCRKFFSVFFKNGETAARIVK